MTEDRKNSSRHVYSFPSQVLSWRFVLVFARERHPCSPPKTQVPPVDVKYISNPPDRFLPFLPHFPEASTYPKGGKRVHRALLLLPIPGGNFPIFSPSAAEGVREGKEGMGRANLMIAMWRGTGRLEKRIPPRERGGREVSLKPLAILAEGKRSRPLFPSSRFPFRFPSYSRKISWRRRSSWEVMPQVLRKAWIRWSRGSPGAPYSRNASRRR